MEVLLGCREAWFKAMVLPQLTFPDRPCRRLARRGAAGGVGSGLGHVGGAQRLWA